MLEVVVSHPGLDAGGLRLTLRPQDTGLALMRRARAVSRALRGRTRPPRPADLAGSGPQIALVPAEAPAAAPRPHAAPRPLQWQRDDGAGLPRWTYSGVGGVGDPSLVALPFAVAPRNHGLAPVPRDRPAFARLSGEDRIAYIDWLEGPRRAEAFRPAFGHLYLQGLEYRLLHDGAPPDETEALVAEIAAVGDLVADADPLAGQAAALLDWLGATGRRSTSDPAQEGPLTRLVQLGRQLAAGQALRAPELLALAPLIHPAEGGARGEGLLSACMAAFPEGLPLRPPRIGLAADYASLSGHCDVHRHLFLRHDRTPVPDLRCSLRLQAALARLLAQVVEAGA